MPTTPQQAKPAGENDVLSSESRSEEQQVASGRAAETPFVVLHAVALAIAGVVAVVVALAFLVYWLA